MLVYGIVLPWRGSLLRSVLKKDSKSPIWFAFTIERNTMATQLTEEQQNAKTKAEAEAFAARMKSKSSSATKVNPFSPSPAKLAAAEKAKAAEAKNKITVTVNGTSTTFTNIFDASTKIQEETLALNAKAKDLNLKSTSRHNEVLKIEVKVETQ